MNGLKNDTCEDTNPAIGSMYYYYYSCCALSFSCGLGQGNCGSDDHCLPGLVCGTKNCLSDFGWGSEEKNCCGPDPVSELTIFLLDKYFPTSTFALHMLALVWTIL